MPTQALSAIAQFGIFYELHQLRRLQEAQFEERRLGWLDAILNQWIDEHREACGIRFAVTDRVAIELNKLTEKLTENPKMDIPQVLVMKLDRVADFLQENYRLQAQVLNLLVETSGSDSEWSLADDLDFLEVARQRLRDAIWYAGVERGKNIKRGLLGSALFLVPFAGPILGGGAIGGSATAAWMSHSSMKAYEPLLETPELARFLILKETLTLSHQYLGEFLRRQQWRVPRQLVVTEGKSNISAGFLRRDKSEVAGLETRLMTTLKALPAPTFAESS